MIMAMTARARFRVLGPLRVLALLLSGFLGQDAAFAQAASAPALAAPTSATLEKKLDALNGLLADPEIRALLEERAGQAAPAASQPDAGKATASPEATAPSMQASSVSETLNALRNHLQALAMSGPALRQQARHASAQLMSEVEERGPFSMVLLTAGFILCGFICDGLLHLLTRHFRHWMLAQSANEPLGRLRALGGRMVYGGLKITAFGLGSIGFFLIFDWPPVIREVILTYLIAALVVRAVLMTFRSLLLPPFLKVEAARDYRVMPMTDARAAHWYRWAGVLALWSSFVGATFLLLKAGGFAPLSIEAIAVPADTVLVALVLVALWTRPAGAVRNSTASSWLLTAYFLSLWLVRLAGAPVLFWYLTAAVLLPAAILHAHRAVLFVLRPPEPESGAAPVMPLLVAVIDRGLRMALIAFVALLLLRLSNLDMAMMTEDDSVLTHLARGALKALVIILAADFAWSLAKALIAHRMGIKGTSGGVEAGHGEGEAAPEAARLLTLLPIIQNMLFAAIAIVAVLMALSSLGIDIAPLIAGAGVLGVAIGFGSQTLVKDVISGILYLFDDAFRIGEYVVSSSYRGTVEGFSLRSIRLRHHRGSIFTVPFGSLGAVQNMSRDWAIEKFSITVDYDTDVELARKLVKKIGQQLAEDPEFAPHVLEPLKMQGIEAFGDYGIELRMKMKTRPGQQFTLRRKAYLAIRKAFEENGIKIPYPTVHVQEGIAGAVAGKLMVDAKMAEELAATEKP